MSEKRGSSCNRLEEELELRRGPWRLEEDALLIHYIARHGEGRWNLLARCSGLKRTGKSCRLRWLNYLKPDIKRGNLSPEEQLLILELHSKWGNRWSRIAQHLPGRTDNEIKNYWRTRVQKQARQLKIDANSAVFRDAVRCYWLPRLLERMGCGTAVESLLSSTAHQFPAHAASSMTTAGTHHELPLRHEAPPHVAVHEYPLGHHQPSMQYDRLIENSSSPYNFSSCTSSGHSPAGAAAAASFPQVANACEFSSNPHDHEQLNSAAFSIYDDGSYQGVNNAYCPGSWEEMAPASTPLMTFGYDSTSDYTTSVDNNCTTTTATTNASTGMDELYGMLKGYMNGVESVSFW